MSLQEPSVDGSGNRVRIVTRGEARVGTPVGDACLAPLQWQGVIEGFEEPQIPGDGKVLQFHITDSNVYDTEMKKRLFIGKLWDLIKVYVQPRFESVRIDLNSPVQTVRELLPLIVARGDAERITQLLETIDLTTAV